MADASNALTVELPSPAERQRRRGGRHLKVVHTKGRRRSAALPVLLCAGVVLVFLFAVAAMHAFLIDGQIQLDDRQSEVASETAAVERLRLEVAELEAPDRVLNVAQERLGMQEPGEIGYVLPDGAAGAGAELLRVSPATVPPPPTTAPPVVAHTPADTASADTGIDDAVTAALASAGIAPNDGTDADPETETSPETETGPDAGGDTPTSETTPTTTGSGAGG